LSADNLNQEINSVVDTNPNNYIPENTSPSQNINLPKITTQSNLIETTNNGVTSEAKTSINSLESNQNNPVTETRDNFIYVEIQSKLKN